MPSEIIEISFRCEVPWVDHMVVNGNMVLGDIVGVVIQDRLPEVVDLFLCDVVVEPAKSHLH